MNTVLSASLLVAMLTALSMGELAAQGSGSDFAALGFEVGKPYPDVVLPRLGDGTAGSISDYRGKKVIVLHFASW